MHRDFMVQERIVTRVLLDYDFALTNTYMYNNNSSYVKMHAEQNKTKQNDHYQAIMCCMYYWPKQ